MDDHQQDASIRQTEEAAAIFRDIASQKAARPTAPPSYAHKAAPVMGLSLGLAYGLAVQFCNSLVSPSIPYTHYPFGIVGNIAASIIGFTLVCWIASLPKDFARGALLASFAAVLILELRAFFISVPLIATLRSPDFFFGLLGLGIELAVAVPVMLILRFTMDVQREHFDKPVWSWPRVALPALFLLAAVGLGFFSLYPEDVRTAMLDTNALITRGLQASTAGELPPALRNENNVQDFLYYGDRPYTLELGDYATFTEDPLAGTYGYTITIIARFKSGYAIACQYESHLENPVCRSYGAKDAPPVTDFRASIPRSPL